MRRRTRGVRRVHFINRIARGQFTNSVQNHALGDTEEAVTLKTNNGITRQMPKTAKTTTQTTSSGNYTEMQSDWSNGCFSCGFSLLQLRWDTRFTLNTKCNSPISNVRLWIKKIHTPKYCKSKLHIDVSCVLKTVQLWSWWRSSDSNKCNRSVTLHTS